MRMRAPAEDSPAAAAEHALSLRLRLRKRRRTQPRLCSVHSRSLGTPTRPAARRHLRVSLVAGCSAVLPAASLVRACSACCLGMDLLAAWAALLLSSA